MIDSSDLRMTSSDVFHNPPPSYPQRSACSWTDPTAVHAEDRFATRWAWPPAPPVAPRYSESGATRRACALSARNCDPPCRRVRRMHRMTRIGPIGRPSAPIRASGAHRAPCFVHPCTDCTSDRPAEAATTTGYGILLRRLARAGRLPLPAEWAASHSSARLRQRAGFRRRMSRTSVRLAPGDAGVVPSGALRSVLLDGVTPLGRRLALTDRCGGRRPSAGEQVADPLSDARDRVDAVRRAVADRLVTQVMRAPQEETDRGRERGIADLVHQAADPLR